MFTDVYETIWNRVSVRAGAQKANTSTAGAAWQPHLASTADLIWDRQLGQGGEFDQHVFAQAAATKRRLSGGAIFAVVPIYVTSICAERCLYCNYRAGNKRSEIERLRLSDEELLQEVKYLVEEKGLRALELVYATDPHLRADSMCRQVELVQKYLDRNGGGSVGINAEALDEGEYRALHDAGLAFAVLWQETYDRARYKELHPGTTKKARFEYRLEAYERMLSAGLRNIGMGVLSGLADWRTDWAMLMAHEGYLQRVYGIEAAILGVPRLKPAAGALLQTTTFIPTRQEFLGALAVHNIYSPRTLPFVNTREDWDLCVDMANGGGCLFTFNCSTIPGGYSLGHRGYQFPTGTYDAPIFAAELQKVGLEPVYDWSFDSRTADRMTRKIA
jgi:2-iminoacetate synthase